MDFLVLIIPILVWLLLLGGIVYGLYTLAKKLIKYGVDLVFEKMKMQDK